MSSSRTHYQLSFTSRQALGFFVGFLLALGVAFFLGLVTGLSGRREESAASGKETGAGRERAPEAASSRVKPGAGQVAGPPPEPTAPATLQTFEDGASPVSPTPAAGSVSPSPARPAPRVPAGAEAWVQVASLLSREQARALAGRLSKRGHHAQIVITAGPKGRLFRVRVGPYPSVEAASAAASRIARDAGVKQTWIVPGGR